MNPLNDYPPWQASEYKATARELQIADFWESRERFLEAFSVCPGLDAVLHNLFVAMNPHESAAVKLIGLDMARKCLEDFVCEVLDDEYLKLAINGIEECVKILQEDN